MFNKKLKRKLEIKDKYLEMIHDIGYDYDGCNTIKSLKELIDELMKYTTKAHQCDDKSCIYFGGNGIKYNILREKI